MSSEHRRAIWRTTGQGLAIVIVVLATTAQPRPPHSAREQISGRREAVVHGESPSHFRELPATCRKELESRGCTIPQITLLSSLHNVVSGQFAKKGQKDWAVLCSKEGKSTIMVFWGGPASCPLELAGGNDRDYLQDFGEERIVYSRRIMPIGANKILKYSTAFGGSKLPPLGHEGIEDMFVGKASVIHYCHEGKWLQLTGAD